MTNLYKTPKTGYFVPVVPDPPTAGPPTVSTTRRMPPSRLFLLLILLVLVALTVGVFIRPDAAPAAAPVVVQVPPAAAPPPPAPEVAPLTDSAATASNAAPAQDQAVPDTSTTPEAIARQYGGSPEQWSQEDPGGRPLAHQSWRFRSLGRDALRFTVPYGVVVQTPIHWYGVGEQVAADDLTLFWL